MSEDKRNKARAKRLKKFFNITLEEYSKVLLYQNNSCAICRKPPKPGKSLAVDHDHKTGLIRGLLCFICNRALGKFKDNNEMLITAADYVVNPPVTKALGEAKYGIKGRVSNKIARMRKLNPEMKL